MKDKIVIPLFLMLYMASGALASSPFKPLLGTAAQPFVEIALQTLDADARYQEAMSAGREFQAMVMIIAEVESGLAGDIHRREALDPSTLSGQAEHDRAMQLSVLEKLNRHSGKSWSEWLGVAAIGEMVQQGVLTEYPSPALEARAEEMLRAFRPFLRPGDQSHHAGPRGHQQVQR